MPPVPPALSSTSTRSRPSCAGSASPRAAVTCPTSASPLRTCWSSPWSSVWSLASCRIEGWPHEVRVHDHRGGVAPLHAGSVQHLLHLHLPAAVGVLPRAAVRGGKRSVPRGRLRSQIGRAHV